jgi:hypothetical protein
MTKKLLTIKTISASLAVMVLLFATSCTKDEDSVIGAPDQPSSVRSVKNPDTQDAIQNFSRELPKIGIYNETMDKWIVVDPYDAKNFSFSDPNSSWNFSNSDEVYFAPAPQGGGILFVGPGAFSNNTGGTVVAGNSSLNIEYTFCFSASDEALNLDLGLGSDFDGVSMVLGIAGDFEALTTGEFDEDEDIFDIFQGIAAYIVYDNEASGSYPVLNWFDDLEEDEPDDLEGNSFAYVFAFQDPGGIYFSKSGNLNVSGGQISFEGVYFGIAGDIFGDWFDDDDVDFEFVEVDGFGTMGCN